MAKKFLIVFFLFPVLLQAQTPVAYERAGDASMQRGDYYSASSFYYKAFLEMSTDASVAFKMAESCRLFNDYENAERYYVRTITLDRDEKIPLSRFYLAEMKQFQGEYDDAKKLYDSYYSHHITDSSYYTLRSKQQSQNCDYAKELLKDTIKCIINNLGSDINTVYSDFAAQLVDSTDLYYSSLRFQNKNKSAKKNKYISKILTSQNEKNIYSVPLPLRDSVNNDDLHNCNSSISPDKKVMVFTRCTQLGDKLMCELYQSKRINDGWSAPVKLNDSLNIKGFTATQPWLTLDGYSGYTLYFVSDRLGGMGKLDIWKSSLDANGNFSSPLNLGSGINTIDDDITPYFDNKTQTLYFSSDGRKGLGGFDIYKAALTEGNYATPDNIGNPINSSFNEIYFTTATDTKYLFSSNRPGSLYIKARTCCYDIYECILKQPFVTVKKTDSLAIIPTKPTEIEPTKKDLEIVQVYKSFLPLKLYFENDQPDPKTVKVFTDKNYVNLYNGYVGNQQTYITSFTANLPANDKTEAEKKVNNFFTGTVVKSFSDLERFTAIMAQQLKEENKIELIVRGSASPLAGNSYNKNLARRRISSLVNYWKSRNENELIGYLKNGKLKIIEEAVGEDLAAKTISDNLKDKRNSVYSPEASALRYIEVIKVRVNGIESK